MALSKEAIAELREAARKAIQPLLDQFADLEAIYAAKAAAKVEARKARDERLASLEKQINAIKDEMLELQGFYGVLGSNAFPREEFPVSEDASRPFSGVLGSVPKRKSGRESGPIETSHFGLRGNVKKPVKDDPIHVLGGCFTH